MSSDSEKALLIAVVRHLGTTKLDFHAIAREIGAPTSNAAYMQWSRFQKKINLSTGSSQIKLTGNCRAAKSPAKSPAKSGNRGKKRKIEKEMTDEDELEDDQDEAAHATPSRKLPGRKARVASFKEMETSEEEENGDEAAENGGDLMDDAEEGESLSDQEEA